MTIFEVMNEIVDNFFSGIYVEVEEGEDDDAN